MERLQLPGVTITTSLTGLNGYDQTPIRFLDTCHDGGWKGPSCKSLGNGIGLRTGVCGPTTYWQGYLFV